MVFFEGLLTSSVIISETTSPALPYPIPDRSPGQALIKGRDIRGCILLSPFIRGSWRGWNRALTWLVSVFTPPSLPPDRSPGQALVKGRSNCTMFDSPPLQGNSSTRIWLCQSCSALGVSCAHRLVPRSFNEGGSFMRRWEGVKPSNHPASESQRRYSQGRHRGFPSLRD
jgi:hypothetical protein